MPVTGCQAAGLVLALNARRFIQDVCFPIGLRELVPGRNLDRPFSWLHFPLFSLFQSCPEYRLSLRFNCQVVPHRGCRDDMK